MKKVTGWAAVVAAPGGIGEGLPVVDLVMGVVRRGVLPRGYRRRVRVLTWTFLGYLSLVLFVTLWSSPQSTQAPGWAEVVIGAATTLGIPLTLPVAEALANVVMFVPFGLLATLLVAPRMVVLGSSGRGVAGRGTGAAHGAGRVWQGGRWTRGIAEAARPAVWRAGGVVVLAGGLFSVLIETVQRLIPGRYSTVQDVVMNTSGALVGAVLVAALVIVVTRRRG